MNIVLDGVAAFNSHQGCELVLLVRALNVLHRKRHHHAIRMMRRLFVYRIDQVKSVLGEVVLISFRINPDGEKLGAKIAGTSFVEADVSIVLGIG